MVPQHQSALSYFASRQGKEINYREVKKQFTAKIYSKRIRRPGRSKNPGQLDFEAFIFELMEFGLIQKKQNKLLIKKPFLVEAQLSVSRSGAGFAVSKASSDIFIPLLKRAGANTKDQIMVKIITKKRNRYEGEVTQVTKSFTNQFLGRILEKRNTFYLVSLVDMPDQPLAALKVSSKKSLKPDDSVVVRIENKNIEIAIPDKSHPRLQKVTRCSLVKEAGLGSNSYSRRNSFLERIILKYSLPPEHSLKQIPLSKDIKKRFRIGIKDPGRKNLQKLYTCTIDGDDAKDFDDAISMEVHEDHVKAYVHIADVAYFVKKGSPLDESAFERSNSYYLKPSVLPMLPPILSEEFCSLRPKTKRLAVTCEMSFDHNAFLLESKFYRSVIYINQRFTYSQAEKKIHQKEQPLQMFWGFAQKLNSVRMKRGGIDLEIPETEMIFDRHNLISDVRPKKRLKSHQLVEEFMLVANIAAARLCNTHKIPAIYRVHESMEKSKLESLNRFLGFIESRVRLKNTEYSSLKNIIDQLHERKRKELFSYVLLRSFMQAKYEPKSKGHWGLGFDDYTHFTSPIRRYSDLVVHRQITAWCEKRKVPHNKKELKKIAEQASERERVAMEAERDSNKLLIMTFIESIKPDISKARLIGFNQSGLFVMLDNPPVGGFIPVNDFDRKGQVVCPNEYQVVVSKYGKTITLGDEIKVQYVKSDWDNMQSIFHLHGFKKS